MAADNEKLLRVWDSDSFPQETAFKHWRNALLVDTPMQSIWQCRQANAFRGRLQIAEYGDLRIARHQSTEYRIYRTDPDIAKSKSEGFLLMYLLSGTITLEQGGRIIHARPGNMWVYDTQTPIDMNVGKSYTIGFEITRDKYSSLEHSGKYQSLALCGARTPLRSCVKLMVEMMTDGKDEEIRAIHDACFSLLPLALSDDQRRMLAPSSPLLREILHTVELELPNPLLAPGFLAAKFGISIRYLHKLFLEIGVTFSGYVTARRLDHVAADLRANSTRRQPLQELAQRWGFSNSNTFHRAFLKRFGCTPRQLYR